MWNERNGHTGGSAEHAERAERTRGTEWNDPEGAPGSCSCPAGTVPTPRPPHRRGNGRVRHLLLGTTQAVHDDGTPVALGGARLRALPAALAFRAGRPVPVNVLVDEVREDDPPADPAEVLPAGELLVDRGVLAGEADGPVKLPACFAPSQPATVARLASGRTSVDRQRTRWSCRRRWDRGHRAPCLHGRPGPPRRAPSSRMAAGRRRAVGGLWFRPFRSSRSRRIRPSRASRTARPRPRTRRVPAAR